MAIDLTPILQAILALLATLITVKLIPWIKARTTAQQQQMISSTVKTLVYAAEQIYGSGGGQKKLLYVQGRLKEKGISVDTAVIECAVKQMSDELKK